MTSHFNSLRSTKTCLHFMHVLVTFTVSKKGKA